MPLALQILPQEYVEIIDRAAAAGLSEDEVYAWKRIVTSLPLEELPSVRDLLDATGSDSSLLRSFIHELSLLDDGNEAEAVKHINEQIALLSA